MKPLLRLLTQFRPYAGWMLVGILASALTLLANVALMALSGWFIAAMALAGASGASMNYFTPAAMIRAAAILRTGGRYLERLVTHEATFRLLARLRVWFYEHLEPLAPAGLETYRSGDLMSRIRADIDSLDSLYVRILVPVAVALIGVTLLTLVMARYDVRLGWVLLSMLLLAGLALPLWTARQGRRPGKEAVESSADLRVAVVDGIQGMAELTLCGANERQAERVSQTSTRLIDAQRRLSRIAGLSQTGLLLGANLALWLVLILAIPLVGRGALAPADLAMLALFTLAAFESVMPLPDAFRLLGQTLAIARRLFEILDRIPAVREPEVGLAEPESFHLRFESVSFRYGEKDPPVLQAIDLDLAPGKRLAVVGPTGSGKSSLIPLLLRFREPQSGRILLGGEVLSRYRGEALRDWIAVVPQQVHLFNASIRDNLSIAAPQGWDSAVGGRKPRAANSTADQARLEQACRIAQIHDFILSQPEGYDTWVGETGVKLSGGQARRIAIARALMRDFHLLVLDEPGEGLDASTQRALMQALFSHLGERGLLLISHHRIGLQEMDEIVRLDQGRIDTHPSFPRPS